MNEKEFIEYCYKAGYAPRLYTKDWIKNNKKESYSSKDAIEVYRKYETNADSYRYDDIAIHYVRNSAMRQGEDPDDVE